MGASVQVDKRYVTQGTMDLLNIKELARVIGETVSELANPFEELLLLLLGKGNCLVWEVPFKTNEDHDRLEFIITFLIMPRDA